MVQKTVKISGMKIKLAGWWTTCLNIDSLVSQEKSLFVSCEKPESSSSSSLFGTHHVSA